MLTYKEGSWRWEFAAEQDTAYKSYCTVPKGVRSHDRELQQVEASGAPDRTRPAWASMRTHGSTHQPCPWDPTLLLLRAPLLPRST